MKKTLVALAALAAVGAASAQSTVSITGVIGAAYQSSDGLRTNAYRGMTLTNADFKLTAMEDLGGGLRAMASASFETPTLPGGASGTFGQGVIRRDTSLALMGEFGTVSFTNTRTTNWLTKGMVAPANLQENIYDNSGIITRMPADVLTYVTKPMNGVQVLAQWVESGSVAHLSPANLAAVGAGTLANTQLDGNAMPSVDSLVLGVMYNQGPLAAGIQYKWHYFTDLAKTLNIHRANRLEAFATYDLGPAKIGFGFDGANIGTFGPDTNTSVQGVSGGAADVSENNVTSANAYSLGVSAPIGSLTVGANWAKRDINNLYELVAKYDLSKRTNINASLGRQSFDRSDNAAGAVLTGQQYRVGLYHNF